MKVAIFSMHQFEKDYLLKANENKHELVLIEARLSDSTVKLASDCKAISIFTGDNADGKNLANLAKLGIRYVALRSAGFNHVDLNSAKALNIKVARVPSYSPHAIAEHSVALMLALNRKLIRANHRLMDLNFKLDGLVGFDMHGKTAGIIGTGKIGSVVAKILHGFGCKLLGVDLVKNQDLIDKYQIEYCTCESLCERSDIITLHTPLNEKTHYLVDEECIDRMKNGVMLINTSRGGLINTKAVIKSLKTKKIGALGIDVYEEEEGLFFEDHSEDILQDDTIARLMTFKNVMITSHQAFLTDTALEEIARTTIYNLDCFENQLKSENELN
ncbi:MAG TPA: 2-hydroxyacid dehydrogenase [Bacteroidia bacterium]|nr:2-hydroxyacid dehydrogenase [Bacteroidia bacterium]